VNPDSYILRTADLISAGQTKESLRRAVASGRLVRIRRGAYCPGEAWRGLDERMRHAVRAAAVVADVADALLCGASAAAVWGIPLAAWPEDVVLLTPYRGGGKSEPGVRRTTVGARQAPVAHHLGLPVTTLARTVIDLAATQGFVAGVVAADWALREGVPRDELRAALRGRTSSYGATAASAVVEFADAASENVGESTARAVIAMLGFQHPELQVVVVDRIGEMRADFRWITPDGRVIFGEFDGKQKYTRDEYTRGDPGEVVWREKKREDRLRATGGGVVRILWSHLADSPGLVALLTEAGVPRRISKRTDPQRSGSNRPAIQPSGTSTPDGAAGRLIG
jgi:predicted transcriptional regulator of viral defense system